jgi:hypothetical protein
MQLEAIVFILHCEITLHVSGALCTHHQEYIKTVDAIYSMICTCDGIYSFTVLLMMGAEST